MKKQIEKIQGMIAKDRLDEALEALKMLIDHGNREDLKPIWTRLSNRWRKYQQEEMTGVLEAWEKEPRRNKWVKDLQSLILQFRQQENTSPLPINTESNPSSTQAPAIELPQQNQAQKKRRVIPWLAIATIIAALITVIGGNQLCNRTYTYTIALQHQNGLQQLIWPADTLIYLELQQGEQKESRVIKDNKAVFHLANKLGADSVNLRLQGRSSYHLCQTQHVLHLEQENKVSICLFAQPTPGPIPVPDIVQAPDPTPPPVKSINFTIECPGIKEIWIDNKRKTPFQTSPDKRMQTIRVSVASSHTLTLFDGENKRIVDNQRFSTQSGKSMTFDCDQQTIQEN